MKSLSLIIALLPLIYFGCAKEPAPSPEPKKETVSSEVSKEIKPTFEVAGGIGLAKIDVGGLSNLDLDSKKTLYYFYKAALVADEIHQSGQDPVERLTKQVFKSILAVENEIPEPLKGKIIPYVKRGLVRGSGSSKTLGRPPFIPGELAAAANIALRKGLDLGIDGLEGIPLGATEIERLEALLNVIRPGLFEYDAIAKNSDGGVEEKVEPKVENKKIELILNYIKSGQVLTSGSEAKALSHLINFLETDSPDSMAEFEKLLTSIHPKVAVIFGYSNSEGATEKEAKAFEAEVVLRDENTHSYAERIIQASSYFNEQITWDGKPAPLKSTSHEPSVRAFQSVALRGASNRSFSGDAVLQGSKSSSFEFGGEDYFLLNVRASLLKNLGPHLVEEFSIDDGVKGRRLECMDSVRDTHFLFRRVLAEKIGSSERWVEHREKFGDLFDALKEVHSNLVALYFAFDPKVQELGLIANSNCAKALVDGYLGAAIEQLIWVDEKGVLTDPILQGRQAILTLLVEKGIAKLVQNEGDYHAGVADYDRLKNGLKELLDEADRVLSTGDVDAAKVLLAGGLKPVDESLRENVRLRYDALGLPRQFVILNPVLEATKDKKGSVIDIKIKKTDTLKDHLNIAHAKY